MRRIAKEIEAHYLEGKEWERLSGPVGELERLRTQAILARHLPPAPAVIVDVGGGAGAYAVPLAKRGYQVHLIDPVQLHLEQAHSYAAKSGVTLASIVRGDARHLDFPRSRADAVLLFGPLYHLVRRSDRFRALREARRVLKPHGVLFAASISRFASLLDGLARGFFQDPEFRKIVEADLARGVHRNETDKPSYFTTAYFHRPGELAAEVSKAGFGDVQILAIEGPAWSTARFGPAWRDREQREKLLELLSWIESESSLQGASAHVMAVAFRPRNHRTA